MIKRAGEIEGGRCRGGGGRGGGGRGHGHLGVVLVLTLLLFHAIPFPRGESERF